MPDAAAIGTTAPAAPPSLLDDGAAPAPALATEPRATEPPADFAGAALSAPTPALAAPAPTPLHASVDSALPDVESDDDEGGEGGEGAGCRLTPVKKVLDSGSDEGSDEGGAGTLSLRQRRRLKDKRKDKEKKKKKKVERDARGERRPVKLL